MTDYDFEVAVFTEVERKFPGAYNGMTFCNGERVARLTCENGMAYVYLFSGPAISAEEDGQAKLNLALKDRMAVHPVNVQRAARAIILHLLRPAR